MNSSTWLTLCAAASFLATTPCFAHFSNCHSANDEVEVYVVYDADAPGGIVDFRVFYNYRRYAFALSGNGVVDSGARDVGAHPGEQVTVDGADGTHFEFRDLSTEKASAAITVGTWSVSYPLTCK